MSDKEGFFYQKTRAIFALLAIAFLEPNAHSGEALGTAFKKPKL